ncbi:hypothetical protein CAPTEDRAFT_109828, partial [Capitella teleta]
LEDLHVKENEFAVFECEVNKKNLPVDWFINEIKIEPSSKHQILAEGVVHRLSINMTKPEDAGDVRAEFRKAVCTAKLTVEPLPYKFIAGLTDMVVIQGETVTMKCKVTKEDGKVIWKKNGKQIKSNRKHEIQRDGTDLTLTLRDITPEEQAEYTCQYEDDTSNCNLLVEGKSCVEHTKFPNPKHPIPTFLHRTR